jgi:hypothetical protein
MMIELGVDELTVVLQATPEMAESMSLEDWPDVADGIVKRFLGLTGLIAIYGDTMPELRCPRGYTEALTLGEHGFYLAMAVNERQPRMGVCVRFSAQALAYYVESAGEPYGLLQDALSPDDYELHLSRIDITVDYFDEGLDVTTIYRGLTDGNVAVMREQMDTRTGELKLRRTASKLSGYAVSDAVPTFYLGSRKANIDALLRVYDKRLEQVERQGTHLSRAQACTDWVRFEASLRHGYATQFGEAMLEVADDGGLGNLIVSVFLQRYRFYCTTAGKWGLASWTQSLADAVGERSIRLFSATSRNNELAASVRYILNGSGLMPLLYKAATIWGDDAPQVMTDWFLQRLDGYEPNPDCRGWLKKNCIDYAKEYSTVDDFLRRGVG